MKKSTVERSIRIWMIIFGISFIVADVLFLFFNEQLWELFDAQAKLFGMAGSPAPAGNKWFFLALANSMMVMITYMAFALAAKPWKNLNYFPVLILSKLTSSFTGVVFFISTSCHEPMCILTGGLDGTPYFSNLAIFLTDFPLAIIAGVLWAQARAVLARKGGRSNATPT